MDAIAAIDGATGPPALPAPPSWLTEEALALEPPWAHERRNVLRDEAALLLDRLLVRVARGQGALDVAIGAGLDALDAGDRALRLGYSSIRDYARERLGIAPRTAQAMARLARELRSRPLLREAVRRGEVSACKARVVLPLARGDAEAGWVARAKSGTVRALDAAARGRAQGAEDADEPWERVEIDLSPEQRAVVDEALSLAGDVIGGRPPTWQRVEALCEEYLGVHPGEPADADAEPDALLPGEPSLEDVKAGLEAEMGDWRWLDEAHAELWAERGPGPAVEAPVPPSAGGPFVDVVRLDADLRRLGAMRDRWDELLGHLAQLVRSLKLWKDMGFATFEHYAVERLGMADRTVAQRAALERKLHALPALREAMRAGRVSYEKARLVASVADEGSADAWIAQAERSTCIALRREIEAREEAQMRARGRIVLRLPARVAVLLHEALRAAQEAHGSPIDPGECLVRVARHFLETWKGHGKRKRKRKVLARDRGWCTVPGCSRAAVHEHHIVHRSAGGSDDPSNRTALCAAHHLHGVHMGYVRVSGLAPDGLTWELGPGPLEIFRPLQ